MKTPKIFVITISKHYPSNHPKKGTATEFRYKVERKDKKHTVRGNYALWKKRIDQINAGVAILSVREWTGKPYYSPQTNLFTYGKGEVGIQPLDLFIDTIGKNKAIGAWVKVDEFERRFIDTNELAKNDGLAIQDFYDWFNKPLIDPCIIHLTDLRY